MENQLKIKVIRGRVLGIELYRGYESLAVLSNISKPDVYDADTNPTGTQRDLSPKHAKDAYEYVKYKEFAFWPEVFLCVRDDSILKYTPLSEDGKYGEIIIDVKKISEKPNTIFISRVDGNHRLYYANGLDKGFDPIDKEVSFCITEKLELDDEIKLFRDINNNQRRMSTSHLDNIESRLTETQILKKRDAPLYIAKKLSEEVESPLYRRVHDGGKKKNKYDIPLRSLKSGIGYMFSRPTKLNALKDPDAQYKLIVNFFLAMKQWVPEAWENPGSYLMLRGVGLWAICFVGAEVIDRVLQNGKFSSEDMLEILKSGKYWDWSNTGDFAGFSGRGGAIKIRDMIVSDFQSSEGLSLHDLYAKIMKE